MAVFGIVLGSGTTEGLIGFLIEHREPDRTWDFGLTEKAPMVFTILQIAEYCKGEEAKSGKRLEAG
jgi:hypothetical protein